MAEFQGEGAEDRMKSALWFHIGKIVDDDTLSRGVNATPQFIGALMEMVWAQIETAARDLETFAQHAGRKTVSVDDVMLLTRRNDGLETLLRGCLEEIQKKEGTSKKKNKR